MVYYHHRHHIYFFVREQLKYRILKKKNTLSRAKFIADKIGMIERGIWVEYFKKHPTDLPKVMKRIGSEYCKHILKKDIRSNYRNPSFNQTYCDWTIFQLENGDFCQYAKLSLIERLDYNLTCLPINKPNPYGINQRWRDGLIRSPGKMMNVGHF